ncbi:MAG: DUF4097 family beta strand repeat-containing protein [Roseiflexus sp.]
MDEQNHERYTTERLPSSRDTPFLSSRLPDESYNRQPAAPQRRGAFFAGLALLTLGIAWLLVRFAGDLLPVTSGGASLVDQTVGGRQIEINADSADVTILRWEQPEFRVQAQQLGWSTGSIDVSVRVDDETVRVLNRASCLFFCGKVHYQITAPATADIRVTTLSGNVQIEAIDGNVTIETTSGDVRLEAIGGTLAVKTVSGDVTLHNGRVPRARVETTSGDVNLGGIRGPLEVTSTSGDISVRDVVEGPVRVNTTSGRISSAGALSSDLSVSSMSGDVRLDLPADTGFRLSIQTISGDIDAPELRGGRGGREWITTLGDGTYALSITTTSGDVRIRQGG